MLKIYLSILLAFEFDFAVLKSYIFQQSKRQLFSSVLNRTGQKIFKNLAFQKCIS